MYTQPELIDKVLELAADANASQRVILNIAAALLKQLDVESYRVEDKQGARLRMTGEGVNWVPYRLELPYGIPRPKEWYIPEWVESARREDLKLTALIEQFKGDRRAALDEYLRQRRRRGGGRNEVFE